MSAFAMVMDHEHRERATEVPLSKRDDAVQHSSLMERRNP